MKNCNRLGVKVLFTIWLAAGWACALQASEGKLFKPLAFTKTFAMISALVIGLLIIPSMAQFIFSIKTNKKQTIDLINYGLIIFGITIIIFSGNFLAIALIMIGINNIFKVKWESLKYYNHKLINIIISLLVIR